MKASELIAELAEEIKKYGDKDIRFTYDHQQGEIVFDVKLIDFDKYQDAIYIDLEDQ